MRIQRHGRGITAELPPFNHAPERPLQFDETFTLKVLGETEERLVACKAAKVVGRRLIARVSEHLCPDTCIQIDRDDSFLWGEVLGSWYEGSAIFAAIEMNQALYGLDELARTLRDEFGGVRPQIRLELALRQCA
jgi:hypothetical protein